MVRRLKSRTFPRVPVLETVTSWKPFSANTAYRFAFNSGEDELPG
jgi:hypothetical protein